jgi:hypothetical protein
MLYYFYTKTTAQTLLPQSIFSFTTLLYGYQESQYHITSLSSF